MFSFIFIILSLSSTFAACPEEGIDFCNNTIEDYIIDGNIDLRTLNSSTQNISILAEKAKSCDITEDRNISDEYELCKILYSSAFPDYSGEKDYCVDNPREQDWIEGLDSTYTLYSSLGITSEDSSSLLALCWGCEAGTYESNEGTSYCDCDEDEQCHNYFTKSTAVAGGTSACFMSCDYQSGTDYCSGLNDLVEYYIGCYCCDEIAYETYNCNNFNYYSAYYYHCVGDEVWKHRWYYDYDCGNGACFYDSSGSGWIDNTYVKTCSCGCSAGECISPCPPDIRVFPTSLIFIID